MTKKVTNENEAVLNENIAVKVSAFDQFYNDNKKTVWACVIAVVVIALGVLGYQKFIYEPACNEAMAATFPAEYAFQAGEFEVALNGDGNNLGFADIIDNYGKKAGVAVYLYAGVCELQLGNFEQALSYLKKYNGTDTILAARAEACKGDCHVELGDLKAAVACYEKAAKSDNILAAEYILKAGVTYEALGETSKALACYEKIKDQYPQSIEAYDIDKYISRIAE